MPTINLEKKDIIKLVGKKLSDDELREAIPMLGTDLEEVGETQVVVEIFPNRPDMLSSEGFARALSSFVGVNTGLREYRVSKSGLKIEVDGSVENVRPFIGCAVLKNVNLSDDAIKSLMQVQEKLHMTHGRKRKKVAIGVHDFDAIKFPVVYKAVRPENLSFVPLGMEKSMNLRQILSDHPKGRDYAFALDGLEDYPVIVDAKNDVVSFPPIINGVVTQVRENTRNIFIDVTGLDRNAVMQALNILVAGIADRGAEIFSVGVNGGECPDMRPVRVKTSIDYVNRHLGLRLNEKEFIALIGKMGLGYDRDVLVPAYRADVLHQVDIAEDVAIAYGYDKFEPVIPNISTVAYEDDLDRFRNIVAELLIGLGMTEANTYHLTNRKNVCENMCAELECVELSNALNEDYNLLRPWMIPSLMDVLKGNKNREFPQRVFEIGVVFSKNSGFETNVEERSVLAAAMSHARAGFTEAKQALDYVMGAVGLEYSIEGLEHGSFIPGRAGKVLCNGKEIGIIGEIHPECLSRWELDMPVCVFEIDFGEMFRLAKKK